MQENYTTDVEYPATYFHFQTPIVMSSVALLTGYEHRFPGSSFTYCDFGCGQGFTLCLLAACNPNAKFYGIDINADHIANVRRTVEQFDLHNITLINASFQHLTPEDLPDLDYAAITGVFSWLPESTRSNLVQYVAGRLKDGGLCFIHYLSMPGVGRTLGTTALTQLLSGQQAGDSAARATAAVSELCNVLEDNPELPFNKASPLTQEVLGRQLKKDPGALAHDILNRNLQPMWFHQVAQAFSQHGLGFVGHARPHMNAFGDIYKHIAAKPYNDFRKKYDDPVLREEMIGFLLDLPVRIDIFGKNLSKSNTDGVSDFSNLSIFSLVGARHGAARTQMKDGVSVDLFQPIYSEMLDAVAKSDQEAATIYDYCSQKYGAEKTRQALLHLYGANLITFGGQSNWALQGERAFSPSAFDKYVLFELLSQPGKAPVPSRLLASCIKLPHMERILLAVLVSNDPKSVWDIISRCDVMLRTLDKQAISDYETFSEMLPGTLEVFKTRRLPSLLRLGLLSL